MNNRNPFTTILAKYRSLAFSERDKGDRFERLMQAYLLTDKQYADQLSNGWLWKDTILSMSRKQFLSVLRMEQVRFADRLWISTPNYSSNN
jgi:predicted helicase